jgi:hypothetical protein
MYEARLAYDKMVFKTNDASAPTPPNYSSTSSVSDMFTTGWNVLVFSYDFLNSTIDFYASASFKAPLTSRSSAVPSFSSGSYILIGTSYDGSASSYTHSLRGIIHTIWIHQHYYSSTEISNLFMPASD